MGIPVPPIGGLPANQQRTAERVKNRAEELEQIYEATLETTVAGTTQRRRRRAAKTSMTPAARSSYLGIPDAPNAFPGHLGTILGHIS